MLHHIYSMFVTDPNASLAIAPLLLAAIIGAVAGEANNKSKQDAADKQRLYEATKAKYMPWKDSNYVQNPNQMADVTQGAASGAAIGQGLGYGMGETPIDESQPVQGSLQNYAPGSNSPGPYAPGAGVGSSSFNPYAQGNVSPGPYAPRSTYAGMVR